MNEEDKLLKSWDAFEATHFGRVQTNEGRICRAMLRQVVELLRDGKPTTELPTNTNP